MGSGRRDCDSRARRFRPFDCTQGRRGADEADGVAIESGAAVALQLCSGQAMPADSGRWVYTASAAVPTGTTGALARLAVAAEGRAAQAEREKAI
jgi:hypothetical protein